MNQKLIVIDGKTYKSLDEMPEDVRRNYESAMRNFDKNQNGTPDILENMNLFPGGNTNDISNAIENIVGHVMSPTNIIADGKMYNSLDELPPEMRAKYELAMGAMDANKNGIPDFVEGMLGTPNQSNHVVTSFGASTPRPASPQPTPVSSTIEPESSGGWMLVLAGILLVGLCLVAGAAGVWYFFLR